MTIEDGFVEDVAGLGDNSERIAEHSVHGFREHESLEEGMTSNDEEEVDQQGGGSSEDESTAEVDEQRLASEDSQSGEDRDSDEEEDTPVANAQVPPAAPARRPRVVRPHHTGPLYVCR